MTRISRWTLVVLALVLAAGGWATTRAQGTSQIASGSLAELTAEVRQLRLTIADAGRAQTQMQALSISLSAQQGRLTQVANRLDGFTEQLNKASDKTQRFGKEMADYPSRLAALTGPDRVQFENFIRAQKTEFDRTVDEENAVRVRYNEALTSFKTEEARWLELVAKLDEIIKR